MTQKNFVDRTFRFNLMRNAAEFNTLGYEQGSENFWNLIKQKQIMENSMKTMCEQMTVYQKRFEIPEGLAKDFTWEVKDGLIGRFPLFC